MKCDISSLKKYGHFVQTLLIKKLQKAINTFVQGALKSRGDVEASVSYRARDVVCSIPAVPFRTQENDNYTCKHICHMFIKNASAGFFSRILLVMDSIRIEESMVFNISGKNLFPQSAIVFFSPLICSAVLRWMPIKCVKTYR